MKLSTTETHQDQKTKRNFTPAVQAQTVMLMSHLSTQGVKDHKGQKQDMAINNQKRFLSFYKRKKRKSYRKIKITKVMNHLIMVKTKRNKMQINIQIQLILKRVTKATTTTMTMS